MPQNPTLPHTITTAERIVLTWPRFDCHEQIIALYAHNGKSADGANLERVLRESTFFKHARQTAQERESGKAYMWYIAQKAPTKTQVGTVIGCLRCDTIRPADDGSYTAVLRGFLDRDFQHQGYMREAIAAVAPLLKEAKIAIVEQDRQPSAETKTLLGDRELIKSEGLYDILCSMQTPSFGQNGI